MSDHVFFAPAPRGLEGILAEELRAQGVARRVRAARAGVSFEGSLEAGYRACLWSRTASRVLLRLATFEAEDAEALYEGVHAMTWEEHLAPGATLAVDFVGTGAGVTNSMFGALKVKDAVVDKLRELRGERPDVDAQTPDVLVNVRVRSHDVVISLDIAGDALHRRGYREQGVQVEAPLKENLAAGALLLAGWPKIAAGGGGLVDPMCGSATFAIEGAWIATDVAPGLLRERWGFSGWAAHDSATWDGLLAEARERRAAGREPGTPVPVLASDIDPRAVEVARACVARAGLRGSVNVEARDAAAAVPPRGAASGLLIANPPYGERLARSGADPVAVVGELLRTSFAGWRGAILAPEEIGVESVGLPIAARHELFNGRIPVLLGVLDPEAVSPGREMFANRLRKNVRLLGKEAKRQGVTCYRVYDADMPEYSAAVELYVGAGADQGRRVCHVAEYEAPRTIDPEAAQRRLAEVVSVVPEVLDVAREDVHLKVRKRQRGSSQYERQDHSRRFMNVAEGGLLFVVNFDDYLDTGLFLDHRETRAMIREVATGTRFLNLFSYTGAVTVYAAAGGAATTTSVDMSATYQEWAGRNMKANGLDGRAHERVQADVFAWLERESAASGADRYDLIFCDPPTFSNSKRMEGSFDVQRDHIPLIEMTSRLLAEGGTMLFSANRRKFRLDVEALRALEFTAEDITSATMPFDFARTGKAHMLWKITRA